MVRSHEELGQRSTPKWDSKLPIADPPSDPREQKGIDAAAHGASKFGLASDLAIAFFADQLEASKLVQFALMADLLAFAATRLQAFGQHGGCDPNAHQSR